MFPVRLTILDALMPVVVNGAFLHGEENPLIFFWCMGIFYNAPKLKI